ncbi:MAG TPA: hypothetical protein VGZ23_11345 [bacterium]|nr:hypothetical protein [bacterium]
MPETSGPVAIESILAEHGRLIERAPERYLPPEDAPPVKAHRAMRYRVRAGLAGLATLIPERDR